MIKNKTYTYWMYEDGFGSQRELFDHISTLVSQTHIRLNVMLLRSNKDPIDCFTEWQPQRFETEIIKKTNHSVAVLLRKNEESIKLLLVKHDTIPTIYYAISDCKSADFKAIFTKFIEKYFPDISKIFLTNNDIYLILDDLGKSHKIMVELAIGKKRLGKKKESIIRYTDKPYKKVFQEIGEADQWIHSVRYRAEPSVNESYKSASKFKGTIRRECYFAIKDDFGTLISKIIPHAIKLASIRNRHLQASSQSASRPMPEPVVIKFYDNLFLDTQKNKDHLESIAAMRSCSISTYHNNPYIHASLVDYKDGSSYDLWALTQDRLVIIPIFEASVASMSRLVNHIFERIGEGKVEKFEEIEPRV